MLMTGSPIPLWCTERLDHPVLVKEVTDKSLVLADGRTVPLPFIKRLPKNDPVVLKALKHGVEVDRDGEVIGILKVATILSGGSTNSDLAGFMDPDGIDDSVLHPDEIKFLKETADRSLDRHGLPYMVLHKAYEMREIYKAAKSRFEHEPNPIRSFSVEQSDQ